MKTITPHLWFDREAKEAAQLYVSSIPDSKIKNVRTIHDTPSGDCDIVSFDLAISFVVPCDTQEEIDYYWDTLSADPNGGQCGCSRTNMACPGKLLPRS